MAKLTVPQTTSAFPLGPQNAEFGAESRPISINDLPPAVRAAFPGLKTLNKLQVAVAGTVLQSEDSLVVNAPTGSGKTVILELAIVKLSLECAPARRPFRVVYLAPTRSLCAEKYHSWRVRFAPLGIGCIQYDGDNELEDIGKLRNYQLILSTPEKWEVFTRHWSDQEVACVLRPIRLFLIDEIQVMDDGTRGANLELVVSRMKYIGSRINREQLDARTGQPESIRFIAVSACIPNVNDIARWLQNERNVQPYSFAETYRTTRIERHVIGFPCTGNAYKFEHDLNYKLAPIIDEYSRQKPTLIFCSSRKSAEMTAGLLARSRMRRFLPPGPILGEMSSQLASKQLQDCVQQGVAYHHAGLLLTDRSCIEYHFRSGHLMALCCTSTLCMGVNLPAYLVIIKSTFSYGGKDYSDNHVLQMIGRAGRAEYNEDGVAVILTADGTADHYRRLVAGTVPVESQLHHKLPELLNSEIAHGIIYDRPAVLEWVRSTFFFVRAHTNPGHYRLAGGRAVEDEIEQLCHETVDSLEQSGLILKRRPNTLLPTACGKLMARNHISFQTMRLLHSEMKGTESVQEMLLLVTKAHEFTEFKCRNNEKRILNSLNAPSGRTDGGPGDEENEEEPAEGVRFRWPGRIGSTAAKVYCLVQAVFGNLTINDHGLQQEAVKMITLGARICSCIVGLLEANGTQLPDGCFRAIESTTRLTQSFRAKLWENSPYLMKQLNQIGPKLARYLADRGKLTFQAVRNSDPRELECILKKQPPFGNELISFIDSLPQFEIEVCRATSTSPADENRSFSCTVCQRNVHYESRALPIVFTVLVGDSANRLLLHRSNCTAETFTPTESGVSRLTWPLHLEPSEGQTVVSLTAHLICLDWVGLDCSHTFHLVETPVTIRHKQTTITHFFPNQTICNETMLEQGDDFTIPDFSTWANQTISGPLSTAGRWNTSTNADLSSRTVHFADTNVPFRPFATNRSIPSDVTKFLRGISVLNRCSVTAKTNINLASSNVNDSTLNINSILSWQRNRLPGFQPPREILPKTPTVKEPIVPNSAASSFYDSLAAIKSSHNLTINSAGGDIFRENLPKNPTVKEPIVPNSAASSFYDSLAALKSSHDLTTNNAGGDISSLAAPEPTVGRVLPLKSILKRPPLRPKDESLQDHHRSFTSVHEPPPKVRAVRTRPYFSSEEFRHMFREQKCTQVFTFCSPSEDIVDCFGRYNIFLPMTLPDRGSGRWYNCMVPDMARSKSPCFFDESILHQTLNETPIPSGVRAKKNFDLGSAENVICWDDDNDG